MAFISIHPKLKLPSTITAVFVIIRVGLMLPPYELDGLLPPTIRGSVLEKGGPEAGNYKRSQREKRK